MRKTRSVARCYTLLLLPVQIGQEMNDRHLTPMFARVSASFPWIAVALEDTSQQVRFSAILHCCQLWSSLLMCNFALPASPCGYVVT